MSQNKNKNQGGSLMGDIFNADKMKLALNLTTEPNDTPMPDIVEEEAQLKRQWIQLEDTSPNIGWLFYKDYYRYEENRRIRITERLVENKMKVEVSGLADKNLKLFKRNLAVYSTPSVSGAKQFILTTTYPGLLIGSGLAHAAGGQEEEFKLGFSFDHTSGLPCIPGSSVKGVLRSILHHLLSDKSIADEDFTAFWSFLMEETTTTFTKSDLKAFLNSSFGSQTKQGDDIFLDAFPSKIGHNTHQAFLGNDAITPHKGALKNPTPLAFLKILPKVSIQFSFLLKPYANESKTIIWAIDDKIKLFKNILKYHGIGAKTNVGYGQFQ